MRPGHRIVAGQLEDEPRPGHTAEGIDTLEHLVAGRAGGEHEGMARELGDRPRTDAVGREHLDHTVDRREHPVGGSVEHPEQRMCGCPVHDRRH